MIDARNGSVGLPKPSAPLGWAETEARKVAEQLHLVLIDVELVHESTGRFLRFYVDKDGGVALSDCEAFHRKIQPQMEKVDYDYMEVSSPGADRPLKKPGDFEKARGEQVEVRLYKPIDGQKIHAGSLVGLIDDCVVIADAEGRERRFEQRQVALVRPLIEFDEDDLKDDIPVDGDEGEE